MKVDSIPLPVLKMETVAERLLRLKPPTKSKTTEETTGILLKKVEKTKYDAVSDDADDGSVKKPRKSVDFEIGEKKSNGQPRLSMGSSPTKGPKQFKTNLKTKDGNRGRINQSNTNNGVPTEGAKPDWATMKQESKAKRLERKKKKSTETVYEISVAAKKIWEDLRMEKGDHAQTTKALYDLLKTQLDKVIFSHDMSRIVQWLLHLGSPEIRTAIITELQPSIKKMIVSKYASKCVKKMLKYGNKESGESIVETFMGSAVVLTNNVFAAPIVEFGYANAASPKQKNRLKQEFYSDLFRLSKDDAITCLADIFKSMPQLKDAHLSCSKRNLKRMIEKKTSQSSLFYAVLNDYLQHCPKADLAEMLGQMREHLHEFLDTEDAADIGMKCIIQSTNKEKKAMMKNFKGHIVRISKEKFNYKIIIAMIDSIDDTVAFGKILLPEVIANVKDLSSNQSGCKVISYLVVHRDVYFFGAKSPDFERLDTFLQNTTSKKPTELRQKDILAVVSAPFLQAIAEDVAFWFAESRIAMVALNILKSGSGEALQKAYSMLAEHLCNESVKIKHEKKMLSLVEHPGTNAVLRKLFKVSHDGVKLFCSILAGILTDATITSWLSTNRGAFALLNLLETGDEATTKEVTNKLEPFIKTLKGSDLQGAKLIVKKLNM